LIAVGVPSSGQTSVNSFLGIWFANIAPDGNTFVHIDCLGFGSLRRVYGLRELLLKPDCVCFVAISEVAFSPPSSLRNSAIGDDQAIQTNLRRRELNTRKAGIF
jgi:hypothetical protein